GWFTVVVERVMMAVLAAEIVRLPVPVRPPENVAAPEDVVVKVVFGPAVTRPLTVKLAVLELAIDVTFEPTGALMTLIAAPAPTRSDERAVGTWLVERVMRPLLEAEIVSW